MFHRKADASIPIRNSQIDTKNILFICGGAFDGLDKIIEKRLDKKSIGFGAEISSKKRKISMYSGRFSPTIC